MKKIHKYNEKHLTFVFSMILFDIHFSFSGTYNDICRGCKANLKSLHNMQGKITKLENELEDLKVTFFKDSFIGN